MKMMHTPVNHNFTINKRGVQEIRLVSHFVHEIFIVVQNKTFFSIHYAHTSMQYTALFHGCKNDNFQMKFLIFFLFLLKT